MFYMPWDTGMHGKDMGMHRGGLRTMQALGWLQRKFKAQVLASNRGFLRLCLSCLPHGTRHAAAGR